MIKAIVVGFSLLASSSCPAAASEGPSVLGRSDLEIIDLTHVLDDAFPYIPVPGVTFPFELQPIASIKSNGVAANAWRIHEHLGTQIDAPNHFTEGGASLEALGAQELIRPVVVIDYRQEAARDRDAELSVDQIRHWEAKHGRIPPGAVVAVYTGWDERIGDPSYVGLDEKGVKHFPGISAQAALFLVKDRAAWGVAVDTISFDPGPDDQYRAHKALLARGGWALEAVANLKRLPPTGATLFIGAPRVRGATGGPARVLALVQRDMSSPPKLEGVWESATAEPLGSDGQGPFLTRRFKFAGDQWEIDYTLSRDREGGKPFLRGRNAGSFRIGGRSRLSDAYEADFGFEARSLTPLDTGTAAALAQAGCGTGGAWQVGEEQSVLERGCAPFRVPAQSACPEEYDVLKLEAEHLFLGARPASGDLCATARRPYAPGAAALLHSQQTSASMASGALPQ